MKLKITDIERIARFKCEEKGCPNKAEGIFKNKWICKECSRRLNPKHKDNVHYVNYIPYRR